ncbi:hypothetical protein KA050_02405, partial [Candidatus Gracilibacteria bacterium]|nr:hypothetical protein [Candidatus Gracilibacteria bacterium]
MVKQSNPAEQEETQLDAALDASLDSMDEEMVLPEEDDVVSSPSEDDLLGPEFDEIGAEKESFLGDDNMNPYLTDEMTDFLNDRITDYSAISKNAGKQNITAGKNLNKVRGISISIAKKEDILAQSHGEILISETINYRTQRPERGGLFCEQIFGPRKNYECACGKYKRIRYKGI